MQAVRRTGTNPEMALRRALHASGLRYRVDWPIPGTRRRADIVFPRAKVAVLVHGCFWHGCPEHATQPKANSAWWTTKLAANQTRDADTVATLERLGFDTLVVWEHEVVADAAARVATAVRRRT